MIPLDASALGELVCSRRYYFRCVIGLPVFNDEMKAGKAIHRVLEGLANKEAPNVEELLKAVPSVYQANFLITAEYLKHRDDLFDLPLVLDKNKVPCTEWRFAFPFGEISVGDQKEDIVLCGTIDHIGYSDWVVITDYKTSRRTKIQDVLQSYQLQLQVYLYIWAIKNYLKAFFEGVPLELIERNRIYGRIRGIFLSFNPCKIEDSEAMPLADSLEQEILTTLQSLAKKAAQIWINKENIPYPEGMAYKICDNCPYYGICITRDTLKIKGILQQSNRTIYDPTAF